MKLFTALFDIVVLPIKVAQDVVCALPDATSWPARAPPL